MNVKKSSGGTLYFICSQKFQTFKCPGTHKISVEDLAYEVTSQIENHLKLFENGKKKKNQKRIKTNFDTAYFGIHNSNWKSTSIDEKKEISEKLIKIIRVFEDKKTIIDWKI